MLDHPIIAQQQFELFENVHVHLNLFDVQKQSTRRALHKNHSIDTDGHPSIRQTSYRVEHEWEIIREQGDNMFQSDAVRQSTSLYGRLRLF